MEDSMRMLSALFGAPATPEDKAELTKIRAAELAAEEHPIYASTTSDGDSAARAVRYGDGRVVIWTNGGMVYPVADAEDAKRKVDALIEAWERGDWRIEERIFPAPEYREDYL